MKIFGSCTDKCLFTVNHLFSKWKEVSKELRTEGEHSILGGNVITWQGQVSKQKRVCKNCRLVEYHEEKT